MLFEKEDYGSLTFFVSQEFACNFFRTFIIYVLGYVPLSPPLLGKGKVTYLESL